MQSAAQIESLIAKARAETASGKLDSAAAAWADVERAAPSHAEAALNLARIALKRGRGSEAIAKFLRAENLASKEAIIPLERAAAHRLVGDSEGEIDALEKALAIDPYCYPALLFKGGWLERQQRPHDAARIYTDAFRILPETIPAGLQPVVAHARETLDQSRRALDAFLKERLAATRARFASERLDRFDECAEAAIGFKKIYVHQPTLLHFPRLPAIQYHDDDLFPWMRELEAASDDMTSELAALIEEDAPGFIPYVRMRPGDPVNQWAELNHSPKWSAFFFYENGARNEENCRRCPKTAAALAKVPMALTPGYSPNAFFSTLAPGGHIPAHTGSTNVRLIGHLPLIDPGQCSFRVGNETRDWTRGKAWVFDDTIEHEAWNRSDRLRVILIFDVWNPLLSQGEREMVSAFLAARREFYAQAEA
ncbi:MAG: aspartyl/asparaginyl beta-hydroxylase domain-containing protein [Parvularculaceae bacterium]